MSTTPSVGDYVRCGHTEGVIVCIDGREAWVLAEKGAYRGHHLTFSIDMLEAAVRS